MDTTDGELNRVSGGWIVPGSMIPLEENLVLVRVRCVYNTNITYLSNLYVSGEESQKQ
jgi:predicted ATP-dependent serine protease